MCGIAGVWGTARLGDVEQMMALLSHRGPDGSGLYQKEHQAILAHIRLAIMDPAAGRQPFVGETEERVLVANGEIYNHRAVRSRLQGEHYFRSESDNETILYHYEERGVAGVADLDGMFAFALVDRGRLILARDPLGIKPLYWGSKLDDKKGDRLYFASEMKALTPFVDSIRTFPPGTLYDSALGMETYYTVPQLEPERFDTPELIRRLRQTLEESVRKRLMSDVPLGAFLSGGLDSSIIAALAIREMGHLHTFSVGVEGSSDLLAAQRVAEHIGSEHHEFTYTIEDVMEILPQVIYHLESYDLDLINSAIPTYFTARLASETVKVILTGEGADELFAGYTYYRSYSDASALHRELHRSVKALHNINLQRVDRLTMCHGIEGRVPFLDTALVELAQRIHPALKLHSAKNGRAVEKWILRRAVEDLLPSDIVWRGKEKFGNGSGTVDLLAEGLSPYLSTVDLEGLAAGSDVALRSAEEAFYFKLFTEVFDRPELLLPNVALWSGVDDAIPKQ